MRIFHPVKSLVASRNLWPIVLSKIWWFFKSSQIHVNIFLKFKGFQICAYFFLSFSGCWIITDWANFSQNKSCKTHLWPRQKLAADLSSLKMSLASSSTCYLRERPYPTQVDRCQVFPFRVGSWPYQRISVQARKSLPGTNTIENLFFLCLWQRGQIS